MSVALYMDVHVHRAITAALRVRGVEVLTAQDDGTIRLEDELLMDRATELGQVLFSNDKDMLAIAHFRQQKDVPFTGVIVAPQSSAIAA